LKKAKSSRSRSNKKTARSGQSIKKEKKEGGRSSRVRGSINSKLSSDTLDKDDGTYSKHRENSISSQETNEVNYNASKPPVVSDLASTK